MEFALSEDQRQFQASLTACLTDCAPLDTIRKIAAGDQAAARAICDTLSDLGTDQILISETEGGLGLGLLDAVLVQETVGSALAPLRFLCNAVAATGLFRLASGSLPASWRADIANGNKRFALALTEQVSAREGAGIDCIDGKLTGKALFVLGFSDATHVLIADRTGNLYCLDAQSEGLTHQTLPTIDRTRVFTEITLKNTPAIALKSDEKQDTPVSRMLQTARLLLAADTIGAAQIMLNKAVSYALERKQFGRQIGSFQAVKHLCAEMAAHLEPARALLWHAAHAVDEDLPEAALMVCLAKAHISEISTFIARSATEVHGGMGFTDLLGLHYWFKRTGANRQLLGSPEQLRHEAAMLQGWA